MKALRIHAFDGVLHPEDISEPSIQPGEVLFEARHIGVNPIDVWVTQGLVAGGRQQLPFVPGVDASGYVDGRPVLAHGAGLGYVRDGFYRERASVPEETVFEIPAGVELSEAAAVGVPGSTAWLLAHRVAGVTSDDRVLVLGCTGGVGSLLVQIVAAQGARVWGHTSTPAKSEYISQHLGCEPVVAGPDSLGADVERVQPTIIFDPLGGAFTSAVAGAAPPHSRIVVYGTSAGASSELDLRTMYKKAVSLHTYGGALMKPEEVRAALHSVLEGLRAGTLRPFVDDTYPLEEAGAALARLQDRGVKGKLLLSVAG